MPRNRHTKPRQLIIRLLKLSPRALAADDLRRAAGRRIPKSTLYRNLDYLTKRGEIYALEGADGVKRYLGHTWHEATFRCQRCGRVRRLNSHTLPDYIQRKMPGWQAVFVSRLEGRGLCKHCAAKL